MNGLREIFQDEIQIDFLFDNYFHFKSWTRTRWIPKWKSNEKIIEGEKEKNVGKNYTSIMRIRRNNKLIYEP